MIAFASLTAAPVVLTWLQPPAARGGRAPRARLLTRRRASRPPAGCGPLGLRAPDAAACAAILLVRANTTRWASSVRTRRFASTRRGSTSIWAVLPLDFVVRRKDRADPVARIVSAARRSRRRSSAALVTGDDVLAVVRQAPSGRRRRAHAPDDQTLTTSSTHRESGHASTAGCRRTSRASVAVWISAVGTAGWRRSWRRSSPTPVASSVRSHVHADRRALPRRARLDAARAPAGDELRHRDRPRRARDRAALPLRDVHDPGAHPERDADPLDGRPHGRRGHRAQHRHRDDRVGRARARGRRQ